MNTSAIVNHKVCRSATIKFYKFNLKFLKKYDLFLGKKEAENILLMSKSPKHAIKAFSAFHNWCVSKNYLPYNVFKGIKLRQKIKETEPAEIISSDDCAKLFKELPEAWQPLFALMAFAGIRPGELISEGTKETLKIGNIDFKNRKITISGNSSKIRKYRILQDLPENLWQWLKPLETRNKNEPIAPASYSSFKKMKSKLSVNLPKDVLRHSFGSYGYYYLGAEHTLDIMGHISGYQVYNRHYKGSGNASDAKEYFNIQKNN